VEIRSDVPSDAVAAGLVAALRLAPTSSRTEAAVLP
jgi:hypothetical protein